MNRNLLILIGFAFIILLLFQSGCSGDSAETYYNRGIEKYKQGDYDKAIEYFTKAIELKPDYVEAYFKRGYTKRINNDDDGVIRDYTRVIELKPDYAEAYNNRGDAKYYGKKNLDGAIIDYTKAIEIKPDYVEAYYSRGDVKFAKGDYDSAIADWEQCIKMSPCDEVKLRIRINQARKAKEKK